MKIKYFILFVINIFHSSFIVYGQNGQVRGDIISNNSDTNRVLIETPSNRISYSVWSFGI
jgi:hypothetical protein